MADHSKPVNTSTYANYTAEIDARFDDLTLGLDSALTTPTNLPTNAIRWNSTTFKNQRWNGTAWVDFTRYDININGTVGATTPNTGAFTALSSTGNTTLGDASADTLTVNATPTFNVAIPAASGGTGQSSYAVGDIVYASTTTALSKLPDVATGNALISGGVGVAPAYGKIGLATHVSGTLPTANGGTNLTTFTSGGALYATSTSALTTGTLPATAGGTGQSSYAVGDLVFASTSTALSKLADVATGNALISGGVGTAPSYGKIGLDTHVSGTLPATNGGTGNNTYAIGDILVGGSTNTLTKVPDVSIGNALLSGGVGVAPTYGKVTLTGHVSGILPVSSGGTNTDTAGIGAFNNITGYTASGATGTTSTNIVFSTSPVLTTPNIGNATATTITASGFVGTSATGAIVAPVGTTAQRPTAVQGMVRYNTSALSFEGYNGSVWGSIGGGAKGGSNDDIFYENSQIVTTSYTITSGKSAMSTGDITIDSGVIITIPTGSRWVIL
jgi:hypothetical protein